ncbi:MAG: hypothetical protein V2I51_00980, partial [Anderseniella sp.]|nr:hypothetical protein [Anderseniella sp.]
MRPSLGRLFSSSAPPNLQHESSSTLIAGRADGFGMMFCNFLYHASVARKLKKDLVLVWPDRMPHLGRAHECGLDLLFKDFTIAFRTIPPGVVKPTQLQKVESDSFLRHIQDLRTEFGQLTENDRIQEIVRQMPVYDYSIHARLGDVEQKPLQHGGRHGRYFPLAGYKSVISKILDNEPLARIFLASNSPQAICLKQEFPDNVTTESELLSAHQSVDSESLVAIWLVIRQLSKSRHIISPMHSSISLLGRVTSAVPVRHSTPAEFLSIEAIITELHQVYSSQAMQFFLSQRLASS